jgi:thiol:disulfide interchange protein DsbD
MTRFRDLLPHRGGGLAAMLLVFAAAAALPVRAGEPEKPPPPPQVEVLSPPENNVTYRARLDPAAPVAGGKGTLIVDVTMRKSVHVYADKRFKVLPVAAKGVTWGKPELPPPLKWVDPNIGGEPEEVWFDKIAVKIPFELAADAVFPLPIASNFKQSCCDDGTCFPAELTKTPVGFTMTSSGIVAPDPGAKKDPPAPAGPAPAAPAPGNPENPPDPPKDPPKEPAEPAEPPSAEPPPGGPPAGGPPAPTDEPPPAAPVEAAVAPTKEPASVAFAGGGVQLTVFVDAKEVRARFVPDKGMYVYAPGSEGGKIVDVNGTAPSAVTWLPVVYPAAIDPHVTDPYEIRAPYQGATSSDAPLRFTVVWQACNEDTCLFGGENFAFDGARVWRVEKEKPAPAPPPAGSPAPAAAGGSPAAGAAASTGLLFPAIGENEDVSEFAALWKKWGILILGWLFLTGVVLAFTPCVLPIIPITVSIIGGGSGNVSRKRLSVLLSFYVLGLGLAFGTMGVVSALTGSAMSAAFQSDTALWVISSIFYLLALGMFGIYELQPPQWMQRLQGGAKGGNVIGAFLFGAMAAVIASPCTGPVIVGLVVFTAQTESVFLGFLFFFTLGLGMGAVFFAAGSLNLVMRPGPWMVWVRYAFGIILVGAAFYYLAHAGRLVPPMLFVVGFASALLIGGAIMHHLVKKQGEEIGMAGGKAAKIAVLLVAATGFVAWITKEPVYEGSGHALVWKQVTTREQLVSEVEYAKKQGKGVLFDITADTCTYCKAYERVMNGDPELHARIEKLHLLQLDNSHPVEGEPGIREGLGLPPIGQPQMVFLDAQGRIHNAQKVLKWYGSEAAAELKKRVVAIEAAR